MINRFFFYGRHISFCVRLISEHELTLGPDSVYLPMFLYEMEAFTETEFCKDGPLPFLSQVISFDEYWSGSYFPSQILKVVPLLFQSYKDKLPQD